MKQFILSAAVALSMFGVQPALAEPAVSGTPASATSDDAERLVLARKLFSLMGLEAQYDSMFTSMMKSLKIPPDSPPEFKERMTRLVASLAANTGSLSADLQDVVARSYAKEFSKDELGAMVSYYASPVGQSRVEKERRVQGDVAPELILAAKNWIELSQVDYCKRASCDDRDRLLFKTLISVYTKPEAPN